MIRQTFVSSLLAFTFVVTGALASEIAIPSEAENKIVGVRIDDLVSNFPSLVPGLASVNANIKKNPEVVFTNGVVQVVHNLFLNAIPAVENGKIVLNATAFVKYKNSSSFFEKISIAYDARSTKMGDLIITFLSKTDLKDMSFRLDVGLVERKLIISDVHHDVKMVFPIGVGGFDEGVMNEGKVSLLTPRFKNGFVDRDAVISRREKPRYFAGKPFIRILKGSDITTDTTAIGFHIEINDSFVRGFDSHGCMRLRLMDLMALHDLIMEGDKQQLPITVAYKIADSSDHPAPKRNKVYKTILNNGTKESPFFPLDRDNLVQMTYKETGAPLAALIDTALDHYEDLFNYETSSQLREQDERRKLDCQKKVAAGEIGASDKEIQRCQSQGKRKETLKDRIYRKYMGIDSIFGDSF